MTGTARQAPPGTARETGLARETVEPLSEPEPEPDAELIAAAVRASPLIAGLADGSFGEISTVLPGRRVRGVRIQPGDITIGVIGRYPATVAEIAAAVRAAAGGAAAGPQRPIHVRILDIAVDQENP